MKIVREIEGLENSISSLINFFKEIKNFKKIFAEDVATFEVLNKKPIVPSDDEISNNSRARSAKLRMAKRV